MASDLIDRRKLGLEPYGEDVHSWYATGWNDAIDAINRAPAVDAEPVRHGEWIPIKMEMRFGTLKGVKCSLCGKEKVREGSNYCPNCGAKMDGGKQDAE